MLMSVLGMVVSFLSFLLPEEEKKSEGRNSTEEFCEYDSFGV